MAQFSILLVDDSPDIISALVRAFKSEGYKIFTAGSVKAGMEILKKENIDLLICDENMPGMPGMELIRYARLHYPQVVRIMLTGRLDLELAKLAINQGEVYRYFNKPWDDYELLLAVRYALKQKMLESNYLKLKQIADNQNKILQSLEKEYPGISKKAMTDDGSIIIEE
ncbi:MAG: response regulator [candidate division Zixibacteria bacterium]|nr:response regulator [candidate division Zixibacteria bacterium]